MESVHKLGVLATAGLLFFLAYGVTFWAGDASSDDSTAIDSIRILTINLLFSEVDDRDNRLKAIADWVAENSVDVLLLQEVVKGPLARTDNSAEDLQEILFDTYGLKYTSRTETEKAVPRLLKVGNSILTRLEVDTRAYKQLPKATEEEVFGIYNFELYRNVIMVALKIDGFPMVHVYNTHLCSGCETDEHEMQLEALLRFVVDVESRSAEVNPVVLGGDFNIDRINKSDEEKSLYEKIVSEGFIDAYAAAAGEHLDSLCEDENNPDLHCTIGASDLGDGKARRIDYIFYKGFRDVSTSKVVFNSVLTNDPSVSDHSAVFTVLSRPGAGDPGSYLPQILFWLLQD